MEFFRQLFFVCVLALFQDLATVQKKVESLQSVAIKSSVNSILDKARELTSRPSALVVPYALVSARETNHPECRRFEVIF